MQKILSELTNYSRQNQEKNVNPNNYQPMTSSRNKFQFPFVLVFFINFLIKDNFKVNLIVI